MVWYWSFYSYPQKWFNWQWNNHTIAIEQVMKQWMIWGNESVLCYNGISSQAQLIHSAPMAGPIQWSHTIPHLKGLSTSSVLIPFKWGMGPGAKLADQIWRMTGTRNTIAAITIRWSHTICWMQFKNSTIPCLMGSTVGSEKQSRAQLSWAFFWTTLHSSITRNGGNPQPFCTLISDDDPDKFQTKGNTRMS